MKYLVIGDGIAGASAAEKLREEDSEASITVLTDESRPLYNRITLKTHVKRGLPLKYAQIHDRKWYTDRDINLHLDTRAEKVDREGKKVVTSGGEFSYDRLLVATGGSPRKLPQDKGFENTYYFWSRKDAEKLRNSVESVEKAVVVGGGFLGLDMAVGYAENDVETHLIMKDGRWFRKGLSKSGAEIIHRKMMEKGINIHTDTEVEELKGNQKVEKVVTDKGKFQTDAVAVGIGLRPNSEFIDVEKDGGEILTDSYLQTSDPDIYAAGAKVKYRCPILKEGKSHGSWSHSEAMGRTAARNMLGENERFEFVNTYGVGHFDVQFQAVGDMAGRPVEKKYSEDEYLRLFFKEGRLVGAVMIGFTKGQEKLKDLIRDRKVVEDEKALLKEEFCS